jgi:hypothetical protein
MAIGWPALIHYPSGMSRVETLLGPMPTKAGDPVEIDRQPTGSWVATEIHAREGEFEGKAYNLQVAVEHPPKE